MTPKEKAQELFDKFYSITGPFTEAKQCALIAVENAVENIESIDSKMINDNFKEALLIYWEAVKQILEKL